MAKPKSTTPTCCLTLPLITEKWQEDILNKRFECARQIYNAILSDKIKNLNRLEHSPEYKNIDKRIKNLKKIKARTEEEKKELSDLKKKKKAIQTAAGFTRYDFTNNAIKYYKHFETSIGSNVTAHCLAKRAWCAFDKYLSGKGKKIHFKRPGEILSLRGYSSSKPKKNANSSGAEIIYHNDGDGSPYITWGKSIRKNSERKNPQKDKKKKFKLFIKLSPNNEYEAEMLKMKVKYVTIVKKPGKTKDHWYVQLALEGYPVKKHCKSTNEVIHPIGQGAVGIDLGTSTIAYSSTSEVGLVELANRVQDIEFEKRIILRKMDRSRRATNPDMYNKDGTFKRGSKSKMLKKSNKYIKLQRRLAYLQHLQAETRKRQHTELVNHLLSLGDIFYVEDMNWAALAKRAKKTEISPKTKRYKRKKRFGKTIANRAPATVIEILKRKCASISPDNSGKQPMVIEVVPNDLKASQYNHITQKYVEKNLSERWNIMPNDKLIQRDLYSAFLLQHCNKDAGDKNNKFQFNKLTLDSDYDNFVIMHDKVIGDLMMLPYTLSNMGIKQLKKLQLNKCEA